MIISFKHNFIYWRPLKVGGTSVVQALGEYCGEDDVVNGSISMIHEVLKAGRKIHKKNFDGYLQHMPPDEIKRISKIDWDSFFKITTVRNPWDMTVSMYWMGRNDTPGATFSEWLRSDAQVGSMFSTEASVFELSFAKQEDYYFKDGERIADHYLKYENLESDYENLCYKIGIPYRELPKLRANIRIDKKHYSHYYNNNDIGLVAEMFPQTIKEFNYEFESDMANRIAV